ncbi:MAG: hypothetical protein JNL52_09365 [Flavobacteriales bacterium]|nr:hypothetical protein [Flavobacteriales bacterium]
MKFITRVVLPALLIAIAPALFGQQAATLVFQLANGPSGQAHKLIHVALLDLDPDAGFSTHQDLIKVRSRISATELLQTFNALGIGDVRPVHDRVVEVPPFPVMQHTGDLIADEAAYNAAKGAWIAAYPEAYRMLLERTNGNPQ